MTIFSSNVLFIGVVKKKIGTIMACGCTKNQAASTPAKTQNVNRTRPLSNGVRGLRTEKRIIR